MLLLAIGLYRANAVSRWAALVTATGAVIFPIGRICQIPALQLASDVALLVSLGWIGRRVLAGSALPALVYPEPETASPAAAQPAG